MFVRVFLICIVLSVTYAMPAVNVVANVRGKKYDITAETIEDFSTQVESLTGLEANQQSVLYKGKVLEATDRLDELGITTGDVLNVLKGKKARISKPEEVESSSSPSFGNNLSADFNGEDPLKNMDPEQMKKTMQAMDNMLDQAHVIDQYFEDEEKLEKARLDMLNNLDQYEQMMPGFKEQAREIASDPEKWRAAMSSARDQIKKLKTQRDAMRGSTDSATAQPTTQSNESLDNSNNSRYIIMYNIIYIVCDMCIYII